MLLPDPGRPSTTSPWRLFCFGFWNTKTIAVCFIIIDEAVSSFRKCGLSYGLHASLCTLQPFRSALTAPPYGCNTRYEWLVRPYSTGTFTQSETPSFAWRTSALVWISLCNLCVLCGSVVEGMHDTTTTETQRTQRLHREEFNLGPDHKSWVFPVNLVRIL